MKNVLLNKRSQFLYRANSEVIFKYIQYTYYTKRDLYSLLIFLYLFITN